jgi:hypothetical protein
MSAHHGKAQKWDLLSFCLAVLLHCPGNKTMNSETFSVIVRFWHNLLTNATQLKVVRVDTIDEVHLSDGNFLLRISRDEDTSVERCLIRHLASGREAYVQGGPNLRVFVKTCLLNNDEPEPPATNTPEEVK